MKFLPSSCLNFSGMKSYIAGLRLGESDVGREFWKLWLSVSPEIRKTFCWGPEWGTPPVAKVMRREARHTQRRDRASGVPLEILEHLPPWPEPAYFTTLCSHLHLWLYGGLSPTTSFGEGVNLGLQLIIIPGHDRSVLTYKIL